MQQAILFKAQGRSSSRPVVVLQHLNLKNACKRTRRFSFKQFFSAMFSGTATKVVAASALGAMWACNFVLEDEAATTAVAAVAAMTMPWALVWVYRLTFNPKQYGL